MKKIKYFWIYLFLMAFISFNSCSDDDVIEPSNDIENPDDKEGPGQPDNIVVSLVASGLQGIIDIEVSPFLELEVKRNIDAEETIALFSKLTEEEVLEELGTEGSYAFFSDELWSLDENPVVFSVGENTKNVNILFKEPQRKDEPQIFILGLYLRSFTKEATIESSKSKIIFKVRIPAKVGTETNPYLLSTVDDLTSMKSKIDAISASQEIYFKLQNDIDLAGVAWTPLLNAHGNLDFQAFRIIHLDGSNHKISNLMCTDKPYASFFGVLVGSCKDITFENANISGNDNPVGIVAGGVGHPSYFSKTKITNTHVSGIVKGAKNKSWDWSNPIHGVGGICGVLRQGSHILKSSSSGNIEGTAVGGIVGDCNNGGGSIGESYYAGGTITAYGIHEEGYAGGIAAKTNNVKISNCYSLGVINSENGKAAGGITGELGPDVSILNCYSTAEIKAKTNAGGIAGRAECNNSGVIACIAWNSTISSADDIGSGLITGWNKGNNLTFQNCYANKNMPFIIPGDNTTANYTEDIINSYIDGSLRYNGKDANGTLIKIAQDILNWDASIWDFSGAKPILK